MTRSATAVNEALEEVWKQGVPHSMADSMLTQQEETLLRESRDRLALADAGADREASAQLANTHRDRLMLAVMAVDDAQTHLCLAQ